MTSRPDRHRCPSLDRALVSIPLLAFASFFAGCVDTNDDLPSTDHPTTTVPSFAEVEGVQRWTGDEVLELGSGADSEVVFGRVVGLALGGSGDVYVADGQSRSIHVFDSDASLRTTLGRPGEGPGEFRMLSGIALSDRGRLWAVDPALRRMTSFGPASGEVHTVPHREDSHDAEVPWRGFLLGDSLLLERRMTGVGPQSGGAVVSSILLPSGLEVVDTTPLPVREVAMVSGSSEGMINYQSPVPFAQLQRWAVTRAGKIWTTSGPGFVFVELTSGGDTARVSRVLQDAPPLTASQQDSLRRIPDLDSDAWPSSRPAVLVMTDFGPDAILVAVEEELDSVSWYTLDEEGSVFGRVDLDLDGDAPDLSVRPVVRDGHLLLVTRDDLGAQAVRKFRLE